MTLFRYKHALCARCNFNHFRPPASAQNNQEAVRRH
jgi:hypothetical protein